MLDDEKLRAAAAARPGYATYPDYQPAGPLDVPDQPAEPPGAAAEPWTGRSAVYRDPGRQWWQTQWRWEVTTSTLVAAGWCLTRPAADRRRALAWTSALRDHLRGCSR